MSAINSNSSDGDLDAIHRAQRAHEPSMEEILASIRNIISDDPAKNAASKRQQPPAPLPTPQTVYSKDASRSHGDAAGLAHRPDANAPTVVWRQPQAVEADPATDAVPRSEESLLSPEANEAVALSFGALSANLEVRSAELADSMVRDMLRPMVKTWLDDNLPTLVERLVREEIQRVARGRK
jgi:cell pole-organizing protein PopZ